MGARGLVYSLPVAKTMMFVAKKESGWNSIEGHKISDGNEV